MPQIVSIIIGGGGLGAVVLAVAVLIRTWQNRKIVNADVAARLTNIGSEMLEDVRRDAAEQIASARRDAAEMIARIRADASAAVERALAEVKRARADAEEARADAAEARRAANLARRDAEDAREAVAEANRRHARFTAELFRGTDPAAVVDRLKALVGRGEPNANGRP